MANQSYQQQMYQGRVMYWRAMLMVPCFCYRPMNPGSGCDACAAQQPLCYFSPGPERNAVIEAQKGFIETKHRFLREYESQGELLVPRTS